MPRVVVVGLGPAGPDLLTSATVAAVERIAHRFVRTARHPSASAVGAAVAFDPVYESEPTFDAVYARIVDELIDAATEHGEVLYAVPGSPLVAERTVELLRADPRVDAEVIPAMSFTDLAWARLQIDPIAAGVRLVDGRRFAVEAAGERGPLLVAQCDSPLVLGDIKLSIDSVSFEQGPGDVVVLQRLGLDDESISTVAWEDLDRVVEPDHLTTLYIPTLAAPVNAELARFVELVRVLRERCPWDREQTHASLTRHLLEETYELIEAIENLDPAPPVGESNGTGSGPVFDSAWEHLEEELGDVLFQVVFHATLAAEEGHFTLADVARQVHDKLVVRHPHVFGDVVAHSAGDVAATWEANKMAEKGRSSRMDGIPAQLPALLFAYKVARKAAAVGVFPEMLAGIDSDDALGDELFALVERARGEGRDPEAVLRTTATAFRDRFIAVESLAAAQGLDPDGLDADTVRLLWTEAERA